MKILLITDIHDDNHCAQNAWHVEDPDLVLDCGDHEELRNVSEFTPHYFIPGNHEPKQVRLDTEGYSLPNRMSSQTVYSFGREGFNVNFAGVGGNYSSRAGDKRVEAGDVENLRSLSPGVLDILLLHESPFNVGRDNGRYDLAQELITEIERIRPSFIFAGHTGKFREEKIKVPGDVLNIINLDDMAHGYGLLEKKGDALKFRRVISRYRGTYVSP